MPFPFIGRVRRLLERAPADPGDTHRRKIESAQASAAHWRRKAERLTQQRARSRKRIEALKRTVEEARAKLLTERRLMLSVEVIEQLFPLRAHRPLFLPDERAAAGAREQRFIQTSANYQRVIAEQAEPQSLQRLIVAGVPWWIPLDERLPERAARAVDQSFPFRALLQTREIAVGGVMLDLGANIGRTSIPRILLGDVRAVYAAEPDPANYAALTRNVVEHRVRGFVLPDNVAIGATRGEVRLRRSRFMGGHRVLGEDAAAKEGAVVVPAWPVDEWLAHHGVDLDTVSFVKVDTQGSEVNVLRGATALLAREGVAWQIEVDPQLLTTFGTSAGELLDLIERHFTHAIDLGPLEPGPRVQPVHQLRQALAYVGTRVHKTDVLLFRAPGAAAS